MDTTGGWHIELVCPGCGARAVYTAVVPSLAADQAARDGWMLDAAVLALPGAREALCPACAEPALRSVG